jgi:hypothetical protein
MTSIQTAPDGRAHQLPWKDQRILHRSRRNGRRRCCDLWRCRISTRSGFRSEMRGGALNRFLLRLGIVFSRHKPGRSGHRDLGPIDRQVEASRAYLYQPETNAHRPLAAIRLKNSGDSALPAGLVTAFETGGDGTVNFAGDAQLPLLPRGASKFVTFALDARTAIRRSDRTPAIGLSQR